MKYLCLKYKKGTKELIGFLPQGDKLKFSREYILQEIEKWNAKDTSPWDYVLCEDAVAEFIASVKMEEGDDVKETLNRVYKDIVADFSNLEDSIGHLTRMHERIFSKEKKEEQ